MGTPVKLSHPGVTVERAAVQWVARRGLEGSFASMVERVRVTDGCARTKGTTCPDAASGCDAFGENERPSYNKAVAENVVQREFEPDTLAEEQSIDFADIEDSVVRAPRPVVCVNAPIGLGRPFGSWSACVESLVTGSLWRLMPKRG